MESKEVAEKQAEETYVQFLKWCKVSFYYMMAILIILASCNFGVEDKKYPNYNGEVYAPTGLSNEK